MIWICCLPINMIMCSGVVIRILTKLILIDSNLSFRQSLSLSQWYMDHLYDLLGLHIGINLQTKIKIESYVHFLIVYLGDLLIDNLSRLWWTLADFSRRWQTFNGWQKSAKVCWSIAIIPLNHKLWTFLQCPQLKICINSFNDYVQHLESTRFTWSTFLRVLQYSMLSFQKCRFNCSSHQSINCVSVLDFL